MFAGKKRAQEEACEHGTEGSAFTEGCHSQTMTRGQGMCLTGGVRDEALQVADIRVQPCKEGPAA